MKNTNLKRGGDNGRDRALAGSQAPPASYRLFPTDFFIGRLNDAAGDSLYCLPLEAEWDGSYTTSNMA